MPFLTDFGAASARLFVAGSLAVAVVAVVGCGEPGAPQPPSLNLPTPIRNLAAARIGNIVHLTWDSTTRTTDRAPMKGVVRMRICRMEGTGPCELVTEQPLKLGQPAHFDDALPSEELQGQPLLLTYYVELLNHSQKSGGRSNAAYSASGQAAPELTSLTATVRPEGVELNWAGSDWPGVPGSKELMRITRVDETPAHPKSSAGPGTKSLLAPGPVNATPLQTLEVPLTTNNRANGKEAHEALDRTAQFGEKYRYEARCVERLTLDGHSIEMSGALSQPATVLTKDTFPPAVPQGLAAAADVASHAIDLSWSPDSEPDLAGYMVYRHIVSSQGVSNSLLQRISGAAPLPTPAFHDTQVDPGMTYAYSVSAVDTNGNESSRSAEAQETLSAPR